jgi:iron complex transport system ATP-binding protein
MIAAKGLAIGWGKGAKAMRLAEGIDLNLSAGEFVALVGPNGSGKSTLLRSLLGLLPPLAGEVLICGSPLRSLSIEERARRAASVFTDRLDPGYFSVRDIVSFGRYPYTDARNRLGPRDRAAVDSALEAVGLGPFASRPLAELSDGERQKALIARALAQDTPLLILDEPTAFLDAPARIEIFHLARRLAHEGGKAVVLSTHDLDHALRYADRLWIIDKEHNFEEGSPEALALSGSLNHAFDAPGIRFDPASASFRSAETHIPYVVRLAAEEGADPTFLAWTGRLVDRLGCLVSEGGQEAGATLTLGYGEGKRPRWVLDDGETRRSFSDLDGLAEALRALAASRRGKGSPGDG